MKKPFLRTWIALAVHRRPGRDGAGAGPSGREARRRRHVGRTARAPGYAHDRSPGTQGFSRRRSARRPQGQDRVAEGLRPEPMGPRRPADVRGYDLRHGVRHQARGDGDVHHAPRRAGPPQAHGQGQGLCPGVRAVHPRRRTARGGRAPLASSDPHLRPASLHRSQRGRTLVREPLPDRDAGQTHRLPAEGIGARDGLHLQLSELYHPGPYPEDR